MEVRPGQVDLASELLNANSVPSTPTNKTFTFPHKPNTPKRRASTSKSAVSTPGVLVTPATKTTPASSKRGLGNRGLATRAKTNPRRVRKSLSSVMFNSAGKALPSPVSSPTGLGMSPVDEMDKWAITTPEKTARSEFVSPAVPEVYLTPASTLRTPGSVSHALGLGLVGDDDDEDKGKGKDALALSPSSGRSGADASTMAQLRAALDPLFTGVVQGHQVGQPLSLDSPSPVVPPAGGLVRRKPSNLRLLFKDEKDMEPWETKLRDLYSDIRAFEQEDGGMSSAGEEAWRGSRRARALGRMSLRRKVDDGASDYAADDSEACDGVVRKGKRAQQEEEEAKRVAGFELARKLQRKSMSTFLEVLLLVQFAVVLVVFVYTAVRRGPKAVLGARRVDRR